jgi:hypothetical protein
VRKSAGHSCKSPLDPDVLVLAKRQHGHVTRKQLLGLGVGRGAITA